MIKEQTSDKVVFTDGYRTLTVLHHNDSMGIILEVEGKGRKIVLEPRENGIDVGFSRQDELDPYIAYFDMYYVDSDEECNDPLRCNKPLIVFGSPGGGDPLAFVHVLDETCVVTFENGVDQIGGTKEDPVYGYANN